MKRAVVALTAVFIFALAFAPIGVRAAASASPGSTTTFMGMPVRQAFTGLTASTAYDLVLYTGTNQTLADDVYSDSDGDLSVTVSTFADYGQNNYELLTSAGAPVLTFNIENMDILDYLFPLIMLGIILSVLGSLKKMGRI